MGVTSKLGGTLQATLCEVERGVFYASYADQEAVSHVDELTHYQTGTSAAEAKRSLESHAQALGYDAVVWTETVVAPLFASEPDALHAERGA